MRDPRPDLEASTRQALVLAWPLALVALAGLAWALATSDLTLRLVAGHTTSNMPLAYKLVPLWSTAAAAPLLMLAVGLPGAVLTLGTARGERLVPAVIALGVLALLAVSVFNAPFARLGWRPLEGDGSAAHWQTLVGSLGAVLRLSVTALLLVPLAWTLQALTTRDAADSRRSWGRAVHWLLALWLLQTTLLALALWSALREPSSLYFLDRQSVTRQGLYPWLALSAWIGVARRRQPQPRRAAVLAAFAGVLLSIVGFIAVHRRVTHDIVLPAGASATITDAAGDRWTFTQQGVSHFRALNRDVVAVTVDVLSPSRKRVLLTPERRQYFDARGEAYASGATMAARTGWRQDVSVVFDSLTAGSAAALRVQFRPFAAVLYAGCAVMILAGTVGWARAWRERA
jgi:cytochrome c biogenesis factor